MTTVETSSEATTRHVPDGLPTHLQHFIDGELRDSIDGSTFDVLDPVSNENYATAAAGQAADVDAAVQAAQRAFDSGVWAEKPARTSRACRWSWAASRRPSSSPTPTST